MNASEQDKKTNLETELHNNIAHNLEYLLSAKNMTKKELSEKLEVSAASVTSWMWLPETDPLKKRSGKTNETSVPALSIVYKMSNLFGISVDELLSPNIQKAEYLPPDILPERKDWYCGAYYCHYFDTSYYPGENNDDDYKVLRYGLLYLYDTEYKDGYPTMKAYAVLGIDSQKNMSNLKRELDRRKGNDFERAASQYIKQTDLTGRLMEYKGVCRQTREMLFIHLGNRGYDYGSIILHSAARSRKPHYTGGLGVCASASKGNELCPCYQLMGLSTNFLKTSPEEISSYLYPDIPKIEADKEAASLMDILKSLNNGTLMKWAGTDSRLSEKEIQILFQDNLERKINEIVSRNLFRSYKVSMRKDHEWYRFCKEFSH